MSETFGEDEVTLALVESQSQTIPTSLTKRSQRVDHGKIEDLKTSVRQRAVLWDSSKPEWRNTDLKNSLWEKVSTSVGEDVSWCKTEWKKQKDSFERRFKKVQGRTGQARKKLEEAPFFTEMLFLKDCPGVANTQSNFDQDVVLDVSQGSSSQDFLMEKSQSADNEEDFEVRNATYSANRNKKRKLDEFETEVIKYLHKDDGQNKESKNDLHHNFCLSIAEQMRSMTPEQASLARLKIQEQIHMILYQ